LSAVFFVVLAMLSLNVLVWETARYDSQLEQAKARAVLESERILEEPEIVGVTVSNSKLNTTVRNNGPVLLHLVGVWVTEYRVPSQAQWHKRFTINYRVNPEGLVKDIGQELSQTLDGDYTYVVKLVTARGNVAVGVYSPLGFSAKTGISTTGYLFFSFTTDAFQYTTPTHQTPTQAWNLTAAPGGDYYVWYAKVSNHGIYDIRLYKTSMMSFILVKKQTSTTQDLFYIVGNTTTYHPNIVAYSELSQVIPANSDGDFNEGGPLQTVKFAANTPGVATVTPWNPTENSEYMILLIFYYQYGSENLTQIIPFAGLHIEP
jgi:hypothetical protein